MTAFVLAAMLVGVLPVDNRSGEAVPGRALQAELREGLAAQGLTLVGAEPLERVLADERIRFTGGVSGEQAEALQRALGLDAVLITTLAQYDGGDPPAIALSSRLVATRGPAILWMDGVALVGDERPGFLGLKVVHDVETLRVRAVDRLARSLAATLAAGRSEPAPGANRFGP
ncbi:MAG TPA: hypothetical protein VJS92_09220, partial [Candidatus Polarisedimenticolaceae bacterium]|nr:hypothetical protein [Candidatus Polarisedimenticolaceae bacterium]